MPAKFVRITTVAALAALCASASSVQPPRAFADEPDRTASPTPDGAAPSVDGAHAPPPPLLVLYPSTPGDSDDIRALASVRSALRGRSYFEVLTYDVESPAVVRAANESHHPEWAAQPVSTDDQRLALAGAMGADYYAVVTHGGRDRKADITMVAVANSARIWTAHDDADREAQLLQDDATAYALEPKPAAVAVAAAPAPSATIASSSTVIVPSPAVAEPTPSPQPVTAPAPAPSTTIAPPSAEPAASMPTVTSTAPDVPVHVEKVGPITQTPPAVEDAPSTPPTPHVVAAAPPSNAPTPNVVAVAPPSNAATPNVVAVAPPPSPTPNVVAVAPAGIATPRPTAPAPEIVPAVVAAVPSEPSSPLHSPTSTDAAPSPSSQSESPGTSLNDDPAAMQQRLDAVRPLIAQGDDAVNRGDIASAIADYRQAIDGAPLSFVPRLKLAQAYLQGGFKDKAISEAKRALEISPDSLPVQEFLIHLDTDENTSQGAVAMYQGLVEKNPTDAGVHVELGDAYWNNDDLGEAESEYKIGLHLSKPGHSRAAEQLARLYAVQSRYDDVLSVLKGLGAARYPLAVKIIQSRSDTLISTLSTAREAFDAGKSSHEEFYDTAKKVKADGDALADFIAKITPPADCRVSHLHRKLAIDLLDQEANVLQQFIETSDASLEDQAEKFEKSAETEMLTAHAAEQKLGLFQDAAPLMAHPAGAQ